MKKGLVSSILLVCTFIVLTSTLLHDPMANTVGYTGAPKAGGTTGASHCTSCHSGTLNAGGGSIIAIGLPSTYTAGSAYNFTIKINHGASDRKKWGFAIKAVETTTDSIVGSFSTTNASASVKKPATQTEELSHTTAPSTSATNTYTFTNLTWTAPVSPTTKQTNIKFYICTVAADGNGSSSNDFVHDTIYTATLSSTPVILSSFATKIINENSVQLNWQTQQELNSSYFDIEKSIDGFFWTSQGTVVAKGNSSIVSNYSYVDNNATAITGKIYYRLKMVDKNGSVQYSSINAALVKASNTSITMQSSQPLALGKSSYYEIVTNVAQSMNIAVVDENGRYIYNTVKTIDQGTTTIQLPLQFIVATKGMYVVKFSVGSFTKTFRQLIQ